jgi:3-hydroxyisobutyrate dehydrogenase
MGKHMAGHVAKLCSANGAPLKVWNRTTARAEEHAAAYGSVCVTDGFKEFNNCGVVFLSLPTTAQVADICSQLNLQAGAIVVDTTSGDPTATIAVANELKVKGVHLVDCPVSGGPKGAEAGTLATMLGGERAICDEVKALLIKTLSQTEKCTICGPIGSGMAVKAINNTMNMAHV